MVFRVVGGAGGQLGRGGGYGALVSGSIPVSPGDVISAVAGGAGGANTAGTSAYGNGGIAIALGGGGGGASAIYLGGKLLAVAGAGGGGQIAGSSSGEGGAKLQYPANGTGNAGQPGLDQYIVPSGSPPSAYYSMTSGGGRGTSTNGGVAGTYRGYKDSAVNGNPGNGHNGGAGVLAVSVANVGGSGGGGAGYFGGGSGAALQWAYSGTNSAISGGGGGGSNYVSDTVAGVSQSLASVAVGSVVVTYS